jgi:hypothetical protein
MKKFIATVLSIQLICISTARADMFGGDVVVLVQILANALQQLIQLKNIVENGKDNMDLLREINRGINDSLGLMRTISPNTDPGIYKDWQNGSDGLTKLNDIYGAPVESRDLQVQRDTDQTVAEAVALNNSNYEYSKAIDEVGELIKQQSHSVSPGGAAKLTAQSLGVMLNLQNQLLRTQATGLKLQAQTLEVQNRKDKDRTRQMVDGADKLTALLTALTPQFTLPRFE